MPTDVDREVRGWLGDHEPLPRNGLQALRGDFAGVGEPTRVDGDALPWLRTTDATSLGRFAYERDVVLYELDDDVAHGVLLGYPAGERRWAPLLLCAAGPPTDAAGVVREIVDAVDRAVAGALVAP